MLKETTSLAPMLKELATKIRDALSQDQFKAANFKKANIVQGMKEAELLFRSNPNWTTATFIASYTFSNMDNSQEYTYTLCLFIEEGPQLFDKEDKEIPRVDYVLAKLFDPYFFTSIDVGQNKYVGDGIIRETFRMNLELASTTDQMVEQIAAFMSKTHMKISILPFPKVQPSVKNG